MGVSVSLEPVAAGPGISFLPVGAHWVSEAVSFRVWAPDHQAVRVATGAEGGETRYIDLARDGEGFFTGRDEGGKVGDLYWYQVDGRLTPDPASRYQPAGVDGPSQVIDPHAFIWTVTDWKRPPLRGRIFYELHIGAFTREGTFRAAIEKLDALVELGVNTLELMPVGDFPGRWNWGYDGVMLFAPARCYGGPDDLRALVDAAHRRGLAVVLDVVYNHLGPCGNALPSLSRDYFHSSRANPWGQAINFDGGRAAPVRQLFLQNACMWLDEYRFDGLRLDAVHAIEDNSSCPLVAEIAALAHARGAFVIAEDERNDPAIITSAAQKGWDVDGMWADDFHHTVRVALTGQQEGYFAGYKGTMDEWADTLRHGWHYRGAIFPLTGRPRGAACDHLSPERFVWCISNHDQVGNRPLGDRLHEVISAEQYRAVSMFLCLLPYTPLLFMGQEWGASTPFPFFSDLPGDLGKLIGKNRVKEFRERQANYPPEILARMPDPQAGSTFASAKLNWHERDKPEHAGILALYRDCLRLRARERVFHAPTRETWQVEKLGSDVVALRSRQPDGDWLMAISIVRGSKSLGAGPFIQPNGERDWNIVFDSNERRFGGTHDVPVQFDRVNLRLEAPGAVLLRES